MQSGAEIKRYFIVNSKACCFVFPEVNIICIAETVISGESSLVLESDPGLAGGCPSSMSFLITHPLCYTR